MYSILLSLALLPPGAPEPKVNAPEPKVNAPGEPEVKIPLAPRQPIVRGVTENDALALAAADSRDLFFADSVFMRYIWIEDADYESYQALCFVTNLFGDGALTYKPVLLGKGKLMVARIDLRKYATRFGGRRLNELIKFFEDFQFEPKLNLLITHDTIGFLEDGNIPKVKKKERVLIDVPPYVHTDGVTYHKKWVDKIVEVPFKESDATLVKFTSDHVSSKLLAELIAKTQSQAPLVSFRYFLFRAVATIEDDGLFKDLYGGRYYELAGIKAGAKKGTDLDVFLQGLGIGNVDAGVDAEKLFDELRSDQRVAVFRSLVTGKPRRVDLLKTLVSRDSTSIVSITHDPEDKDIDIGRHPMMSLIKIKDRAREVIAEKANGLHLFAAFNGKGALQREVPFNVANDSTVPSPHTQRLQPGIGCIRCHGGEGGWRILTNDVKKLLAGYIDIFGDNADRNKTIPDVLDRLAGLYAGDVERKLLPRARDDYATAVLNATGHWKRSKDQLNLVQLVSKKVGDVYNEYWYDRIDAAALKELGYLDIDQDPAKLQLAVDTLKRILPPVNVVINGVIPEDPRIAALLMGLSINRFEFDLVYSFMATRIMKAGVK